MASTAVEQELNPPLGEESLGVVHGKIGMWTFLVMDAMTFAGFLAAYARLRWGVGGGTDAPWPYPYDTFGQVGIQLTALNTFVLVCSSVSMVHALAQTLKGDMKVARGWLVVTILGGLLFLGIQGFEWTHLIKDIFFAPTLEGTNKNFAATFFCLTGFHGCHVAVGVIYNLIIFLGMRSGKIHQGNASLVEIAGLYWHFVDLIWILVFTFVYLI